MVANFYKIEAKDVLVIHDDIDLPVGKIQLKL
jgi:peptidyl-tRNA hydrolase